MNDRRSIVVRSADVELVAVAEPPHAADLFRAQRAAAGRPVEHQHVEGDAAGVVRHLRRAPGEDDAVGGVVDAQAHMANIARKTIIRKA